MTESIHTQSVARDFAVVDELVLCETATTRIVFRPAIHSDGVRGHLIRQKRGADKSWADTNDVNFAQMPPDSGVRIELDTAATAKLFERLTSLYAVQKDHRALFGDHRFVVGEENEVIRVTDRNKKRIIDALLSQGLTDDFWDALVATDPDIATRLAAGQIQHDRLTAIEEFAAALLPKSNDEAYWQTFFEKHPWILQSVFSSAVYLLRGDVYVGGKRPINRQGHGGVATDFLFEDESTKSFAVVEIKKPSTKLVGSVYRGDRDTEDDNEVYTMHPALTGGIVQTRNQIAVAVDHFESVLGREFYKLNRVHPKGVLVAGTLSGLNDRERESFNLFRHGLHSLTVITYDELLKRLRLLFAAETEETVEAGPASADDDIPF